MKTTESTKKFATKKATPKPAAAAATTKAEKTERVGSYAGKKIVVLNKNHGARPESIRGKAMEIILKSRTTDEAIPAIKKVGANNAFLAFAVSKGFVKLA